MSDTPSRLSEDTDKRLVECPNSHDQRPGRPGDATQVEYEYWFVTDEKGHHNYCQTCGEPMEWVNESGGPMSGRSGRE